MKREDLPKLPDTPGVYKYLGAEQNILYIGKAKNLRKRVRSYFSGAQSKKTQRLIDQATRVQTLTTRNEVEALLLENQLIKEHKPKYNILLRENKRYAWICVTKEEYPRILTARTKKRDANYYGPYTDGSARRKIVITLNKLFKLRTCRALPNTVCLQYHINNCTGPCEEHASKEEYVQQVRDAEDVLKGNTRELKKRLDKQMRQASKELDFEKAKQLRDTISSLEELEKRQVVEQTNNYDQDIIAHSQEQEETAFAVIHVRNGVIREKDEFSIQTRNQEVLEEFITAYYRERTPPKEIITQALDEETRQALEEYLSRQTTNAVTITTPQRGDKKKLLLLAQENAQQQLGQENPALQELQKHLNLSSPPLAIDCFDVSNLQDTHAVAACIRYYNAKPQPTKYRRFNLGDMRKADDYAGIQEAVRRRYRQGDLPDLIVIDGGKGQLSAARKELPKNTPVISLAKQEEEVYVPGLSNPLPIPQKNPGLLLLRRIRDATHRFAITYHRKKRSAAMTSSTLDYLQGIGPKRKQALYNKFKTLKAIKQASKQQLQDVLGEKTGQHVYHQLHQETNTDKKNSKT